MILIPILRAAAEEGGHMAKRLASAVVKPHNPGLRCVFRPNAPSRAIA